MRGSAAMALVLLVVGVAGCSEEAPPPKVAPALSFGTMTLETVPLEPWEARGVMQLQWTGQDFAVWTQGEGGMPQRAVRVGDTLYVSDTGMGWTAWDLQDYAAAEGRGFRYLAWDVVRLLQDATVTAVEDGLVEAAARFEARGQGHETGLVIHHEAGVVRSVVITTTADLESPYTLTSTTMPLPFAAVRPAGAVSQADVVALQDESSYNHAKIIGWIDEYVATLGRTPTDVDADGLALQRLEESWPVNPFDDRPVEAKQASGHFAWRVCTPQDAQYTGYGLDGEILGKSYGRGCA